MLNRKQRISVYAFGTGGKRKRIIQDIYFSVEDYEGVGILYTKTGLHQLEQFVNSFPV